jgi:hypothetical protein
MGGVLGFHNAFVLSTLFYVVIYFKCCIQVSFVHVIGNSLPL